MSWLVRLKPVLQAASMTLCLASWLPIAAQELTIRCDPAPGSLGKLSKAQKEAFMKSQDAFLAGRFADAAAALRNLLTEVPHGSSAETALAERAAEAALEAGDRAYAISLLKPIEERDETDCPAHALLARANAEEGRTAERDAELNSLVKLHQQFPKSAAGKLDTFLLEKRGLAGGGAVAIWYALRPYGPHHTYLNAEIANAAGKMLVHIELDSDDGDQVYFKEEHPDLATKGERKYSLDAFMPTEGAASSQTGNQHALIQFYDGAPKYDTVRERILAIADRAAKFTQ